MIAIAIATGLIFLLVLIGLLATIWSRPSDRSLQAAAVKHDHNSVMSDGSSVHQRRLGAIQEAIFGGAGGVALASSAAGRKQGEKNSPVASPRSSFGDAYDHADNHEYHDDTQGAEVAAAAAESSNDPSSDTHDSSAPSHRGRPTTVKHSFIGQEEPELTVNGNDQIWVLEEGPHEQWSYVRTSEGREGVVPASYIW